VSCVLRFAWLGFVFRVRVSTSSTGMILSPKFAIFMKSKRENPKSIQQANIMKHATVSHSIDRDTIHSCRHTNARSSCIKAGQGGQNRTAAKICLHYHRPLLPLYLLKHISWLIVSCLTPKISERASANLNGEKLNMII